MSPQGGHGADIYRELGAYNVLMYSRIENDNQNPDFITGNQIAKLVLLKILSNSVQQLYFLPIKQVQQVLSNL